MDSLRSHLIMNAPLSVDHIQSSLFDGFAVAPTQKWWTGNDQLSKVHSLLNDFLRNTYWNSNVVWPLNQRLWKKVITDGVYFEEIRQFSIYGTTNISLKSLMTN